MDSFFNFFISLFLSSIIAFNSSIFFSSFVILQLLDSLIFYAHKFRAKFYLILIGVSFYF